MYNLKDLLGEELTLKKKKKLRGEDSLQKVPTRKLYKQWKNKFKGSEK